MEQVVTPSIYDMIFNSTPVVQSVLILLILLSLLSWAIAIGKFLQFSKAKKDSSVFTKIFWETRNLSKIDDSARNLQASPLVHIFTAGYRELTFQLHEHSEKKKKGEESADGGELESLEMALKRSQMEISHKLEKGLTFLATVASAAPFIGLFGTVWGIMNAFHGLGTSGTSTIQAVAPGISEALVATAVGLAAAIPSSVAYNYFTVTVKNYRSKMVRFSEEFMHVAENSFA